MLIDWLIDFTCETFKRFKSGSADSRLSPFDFNHFLHSDNINYEINESYFTDIFYREVPAKPLSTALPTRDIDRKCFAVSPWWHLNSLCHLSIPSSNLTLFVEVQVSTHKMICMQVLVSRVHTRWRIPGSFSNHCG